MQVSGAGRRDGDAAGMLGLECARARFDDQKEQVIQHRMDSHLLQIIAGLRKHIAQEDLQGRLVTCILNLKTAKLAGEASEGMILAAVHKGDTFEHGELVTPLSVPGAACFLVGRQFTPALITGNSKLASVAEGCKPGDPVFLEGSQQLETFPKEFKHWKKMLPHLAVKHTIDGCAATFNGTSLVTSLGALRVDAAMPDGAAIS